MPERYYKKAYSHGDFYRSLVWAFRSAKHLRLNRRKKLVFPQFKERIMLAVTEVNGCFACSYAHTKFALEEGMSREEIDAILTGDIADCPKEELVGILFAQYYTDNNWVVSKESLQRLVDEYGEAKGMIILAATRMIIVGNIYGMAVSAIWDRLKGRHTGKTRLWYQISMLLAAPVYFPVALVHAVINNMRKKSLLPLAADELT